MQRLILVIPIALALLVTFVALWPEAERPPIKVGVLHSLTGTMAISEKPVMQATLLAIEQINAQGGLLGRKLEAVVVDGKSDWSTFAYEAERLIAEEKVSVVFGCWTSVCRKTVKPIFEKYNHLLFYPVQYEGLERSPNIIYTGATPNQQIIPAVSWAVKQFGPRVYLLGSDYVFPRVANWLITKVLRASSGTVVGEQYIPLGDHDIKAVVAEIERLKPDVVLNSINGDSNIAFFHALKGAGISAKEVPVISFSMGEAELAQMHGDADATGHYAVWNYFQSIDNQKNRDFIQAFQTRFGSDIPLSDPMEAAWLGVKLWAKAVRAAQTDDVGVIRTTISHQSIVAPEGIVSIDHHSHHSWKTVRIGQIRSDGQFDILWTSAEPVRPDPFPPFISKPEAALKLEQLYKGWGNQWAKPASSDKSLGNRH